MMNAADRRPAAQILGIDVDAIDMDRAIAHIADLLEASLAGRRKGYICVAGVHGVMEAQRDARLREIYSGSAMTIPDGMPLVWVGRLQGHTAMRRVTGPDLMAEVFARKELAGATHFLYGGQEGVADELRDKLLQRFPSAKIVGTFTPPFRDLTELEEEQVAARIGALKPDIVWVGISTPRQEQFMARYLHRFDTTLMFGVGAAFDYHTGRIRDCAGWIKRAGLQWLHRLLQDPRRLWRRYLRNNPAFLWLVALQLLGRKRSAPSFATGGAPSVSPDSRNVCGQGYAGGEGGVKTATRSAAGLATES